MATIVAAAGGGNFATGGTWVGGVAPTAADDAQLTGTSGNVTINSGSVCRSLDCTGYTGTLTHTAAITLTIGDGTAGASNIALKLVSGMTYTKGNADTSAISFISTSATTQTIDSGGKTLGNVTINGAGSSYQLSAASTIAVTSTLNLTAGTFNTNNQTCSWGFFSSSNSNTRTLTLGSSTITMTGVGTAWQMSSTTNMTLNSDTSQITFNNASGATMQTGTSKTYYNVTFTGLNNTVGGSGTGPVFNNLTNTPAAGNIVLFLFTVNTTVSTTFTVTGTDSGTDAGRVLITPVFVSQTSDAKTITAAAVAFTNVDFADITAAGAAIPWTGTSIGNGGGTSNITFTSSTTRYWVGNGGNWRAFAKWSTSSGGAGGASIPLPQDDVIFDANSITSGSQTITGSSMRILGKNIDMSAMVNNPTLAFAGQNVALCGNLALASGMTFSGSQNLILYGRGSQTLTTNGASISLILNITATGGGSYTLQDNLTVTNQISHSAGTLDANGKNVTATVLVSSNSNTRALTMGSGTWTVNSTGTIWNMGTVTGLTVNRNTSKVIVSDTSATAKTFIAPNGKTLYNIEITGGGSGAVTWQWTDTSSSRSGTINTISVVGGAKTIIFQAGQTTFVEGTLPSGTAGNIVTYQSSTGASAYIFSRISGIVNVDYVSLQDSTATGGASFFAGPNSTNVSGNTGWLFNASGLAVSDSSTASESIQRLLESNISRSDTATLSESIDALRDNARDLIVFESSTVTESYSAFLPFLAKLLSDTVTLSESRTLDVPIGIERTPEKYQDGPGVRIV